MGKKIHSKPNKSLWGAAQCLPLMREVPSASEAEGEKKVIGNSEEGIGEVSLRDY